MEEEIKKRTFCGVLCNDCGTELKYVSYNSVLLSVPAQKAVKCPKCGKCDYMIVE
jgi:uncharacterized protein with PIN domain